MNAFIECSVYKEFLIKIQYLYRGCVQNPLDFKFLRVRFNLVIPVTPTGANPRLQGPIRSSHHDRSHQRSLCDLPI